MAERMQGWKLEEEEGGRDIVVMRTQLPWPLKSRFMISCLYHTEQNGEYITIQSQRGNEFYYKKYAE